MNGVAREPLFKPVVPKVANVPAEAIVDSAVTNRPDKEPLFKPPVVKSVVRKPVEEAVTEVAAKKEPGEAESVPPPTTALPKVEVRTAPPATENALEPAKPAVDEAPPPPPVKPVQPAPTEQPAEPEPSPAPQPVLPPPMPVIPPPREELPPADPLAAPPGMPAPVPVELPLASVSTAIGPRTGRLPLDRAPEWVERKAAESYLFAEVGVVYYWDAPNFCYQPLYYEQPNVERLGYSRCAALQPAISGIHFFAQTLALPYQMTVHPYRRECMYPLGHYRPGNPAPYRLIYPEWNARAAAVQAAATTGLIFVLP